jgi:hypothetical protein
MTQAPNPNKDEWIQKAKALLYDCKWSVDSDGLVKEIETLIKEGGGYDPLVETSKGKLRWRK